MQNSLYVALSSQVSLDKRLTTLADNVANLGTVGFRATEVKFEELVTGRGDKSVAFSSAGDTFVSTRAGEMRQTGNAFDFAVRGEAWFAIDTPAGMVLTRDGRFELLDTGDLVTVEGHPVLDVGGAPIQLDPQGGAPVAGADGMLTQNGRQVGAIGLFAYEPGRNPTRYGNSGVLPSTPPEPIVDAGQGAVVQGFVEESNVNPILEITRLIALQRTFENTSAMIRSTESTFSEAIKTLGGK